MLDVEFMLSEPTFDRPIIYLTRTRALHNAFVFHLNRHLDANGMGPLGPAKAATGFFPVTPIYHWRPGRSRAASPVNQFIERFSGGFCVVLASAGARLFSQPDWAKALSLFLIIEEPRVEPKTLGSILKYLDLSSPLGTGGKLSNVGAFRAYFADLIQSTDVELPDFLQFYNETMLLGVDPNTSDFDRRKVPSVSIDRRRLSLRRQLRAIYFNNPTRSMPSSVVRLLGLIYNGDYLPGGIHHLMDIVTQRLLRHVDTAPSDSLAVDILRAVHLLVWREIGKESTEREVFGDHPDVAPIFILAMLDDLRSRLLRLDGSDPLSGMYSALPVCISSSNQTSASTKHLIDAVCASLSLPLTDDEWIIRLRHLFSDASNRMNELASRANAIPVTESIVNMSTDEAFIYPRTLARTGLLSGLWSKRFDAKDHSRPLILAGAHQAGKTTAALTYAMALQCEDRLAGNLPCSNCPGCRSILEGGWSFGRFDASLVDASDVRQQLSSKLKTAVPDNSHLVIIIENLELAPDLGDALLKVFEAPLNRVTFIVCVEDISKLAWTLRSRSDVVVIPPVIKSCELADFVRKYNSLELGDDPRLSEIIIKLSRGLPGLIVRIASELSNAGITDFVSAKRALKLDWAADLVVACASLIGGHRHDNADDAEYNVLLNRDRLMTILIELRSRRQGHDPFHPAFVGLTSNLDMLVAILDQQASKQSLSSDILWNRLRELWASFDPDRRDALNWLTHNTNEMLYHRQAITIG